MDFLEHEALRQLVIEELTKIGGKMKGDEIGILCCFHDDKHPSLNVYVGQSKMPGIFKCWSCGAYGGWNKLAQALRMPLFQFKDQKIPQGMANSGKVVSAKNDGNVNVFEVLEKSLINSSPLKTEEPRSLRGTEPLPDDFQWRGINRETLVDLGARYYFENRTKFDYIYFPLSINGHYKGYTLCALDRENNKLKYQTFAKTEEVLFFYDNFVGYEPLVLVEGHFDAIRLMAEGIPTMAIFGTENWSDIKRELIVAKCPKKVLILFDGDEAGYKAAVKVFNDLRAGVKVDIMYLPDMGDKSKNLDPGNMPIEYINELKRRLYD